MRERPIVFIRTDGEFCNPHCDFFVKEFGDSCYCALFHRYLAREKRVERWMDCLKVRDGGLVKVVILRNE